jgi:hypothetical protein
MTKHHCDIIVACKKAGLSKGPLEKVVEVLTMDYQFSRPAIYEDDGQVIMEWPDGMTLSYHFIEQNEVKDTP